MMWMLLNGLARFLGPAGLAAVAAFIYWEGLPIIRDVPSVRLVPIIGPSVDRIAQGRVGVQYRAGQRAERQVWEERQDRERARQAAALAEAQNTIAVLERENWQREVNAALQLSALDQALQQSQQESDNGEDNACSGTPAISRGVSRALDQLGR